MSHRTLHSYCPSLSLPPEVFKSTPTIFTQKYDVYCLGTLLWMLTVRFTPRGNAGSPPSSALSGMRENPIPTTPTGYMEIYKWDPIPDNRPTVHQVLYALENVEMELAQATRLDDKPEARNVMMPTPCSVQFQTAVTVFIRRPILQQRRATKASIYDELFERAVIEIELATTQLLKAMFENRALVEKTWQIYDTQLQSSRNLVMNRSLYSYV
ncbi:hypothetical protein BC937DRAFT_89825 [Endogone sp. FLAS-F59071]|nr:hypothetical protein BC937DRAFT_89825 [Endogone sp. FLAS-F59071]|eukprot:RUS17549.1 hypothetical protein BC937DRAFT_89825 [Endogone sp. FLAS-F59071]